MKKLAAIDIGTNSMRLLLCSCENKKIIKKSKELAVTRIGQHVSRDGVISEEAMLRNIESLKHFSDKARSFGAEEVVAIATSAVRDAANGDAFKTLVKHKTGVDIRIISGDEEAELGILGVMSEEEDENKGILVVDIGGGSTELVFWTKGSIEYATSIRAGAVRMTEGFITNNPIAKGEIADLKKHLHEIFELPIEHIKSKKIDKIIGIGGTATTAAAIFHKLSIYNPETVHNTAITVKHLEEMFEDLSNMSVEKRKQVPGLQPERADVIPSGLCILIHILKNIGDSQIHVSENDNLEGAILKYALMQ